MTDYIEGTDIHGEPITAATPVQNIPKEQQTIDEQAQASLYEAASLYQQNIVPLLMSINPTTMESKEAFGVAFGIKQLIDSHWDLRALPIMKKLHTHNSSKRPPAPHPQPEELP